MILALRTSNIPRNRSLVLPNACKESNGSINCKCTLIILPLTLVSQWKSEIQKHAPSLKVTEYNGMMSIPNYKKLKRKHYRKMFEKYDIVITTYEVLRKDVHFVSGHSMKTRSPDSKQMPRSPLVKGTCFSSCVTLY